MVEGVTTGLPRVASENAMQYLMGFLALVGVFLIVLGFWQGSFALVILGGIVLVLALVMFILLAILGLFAAAREGVETARQAKDLVDEVAPGAIPAVQKGVRTGINIAHAGANVVRQRAQQRSVLPPSSPPPTTSPEVPIYHACPTCGAGNTPGDAYCHYCKRPLYWEVSRGGPER